MAKRLIENNNNDWIIEQQNGDFVVRDNQWKIERIFNYFKSSDFESNETLYHPLTQYDCPKCQYYFRMYQSIVFRNSSPQWMWDMMCGSETITFHCQNCKEVISKFVAMKN